MRGKNAPQLTVNCQSVDCRQNTILTDNSGDQRSTKLFPESSSRILSPVDRNACQQAVVWLKTWQPRPWLSQQQDARHAFAGKVGTLQISAPYIRLPETRKAGDKMDSFGTRRQTVAAHLPFLLVAQSY